MAIIFYILLFYKCLFVQSLLKTGYCCLSSSKARQGERPCHAKDFATYTLLHPLFYPAFWTNLYKKFTRALVCSFHKPTTPLLAASRLPLLAKLTLVITPFVLRFATDTCSQSGRLITLP